MSILNPKTDPKWPIWPKTGGPAINKNKSNMANNNGNINNSYKWNAMQNINMIRYAIYDLCLCQLKIRQKWAKFDL